MTLEIHFEGTAVEDHTIKVRELSASLIGFADAIDEYKNLNEPMLDLDVNIKALQKGSFEVVLQLVGIIGPVVDAFTGGANPTNIAGIAKGIIETARIFKDRIEATGHALPSVSEKVKQSETNVNVDFGTGTHFSYSRKAYAASRSKAMAESLGTAARPSLLEGFDPVRFKIPATGDDIEIGSDETKALANAKMPDQILEPEISERTLQIEVIQRTSDKWQFRYNDETFYAEILDTAFLKRFTDRELAYYAGDMLKVKLRTELSVVDGILKSGKRTILKVIDYIRLERQPAFDI